MRKGIYLIMFLVLISSVYADKVSIFNFNYNNGEIILKEQLIKEGYYPDRNIQVKEGYNCRLVDKNNNNIYSFRFELPMKLYTDVIDNHKLVGAVIILNETDFSFITPYFLESSNIVCSNPRGYEILNEQTLHIALSYEKYNKWLWFYSVIGLVLLFVLILILRKRKLNN
ncbi:hypothetical protein CEE44_01515 [Candidatus Woesearchaeota archaeon B3_Woes]|nr:MAG: hypothetical protein CEE44_01515 [Candidatus Woesearchaeota archaeon B3_Woes]